MVNEGVYPFVPSTDIGNVRVLIGDTDPVRIGTGNSGTYKFYSDIEVEAIIDIYGGNIKRSAAAILRSIAASQVLILKAFSTDDLRVDGSKVADSLRLLAADLEKAADAEDALSSDDLWKSVPFAGYNFQPTNIEGLPRWNLEY